MPDLVYPVLTGHVRAGAYPMFLNAAEPWAADDPFVREHPEFFSTNPQGEPRRSVPLAPQVEQATAAPGEKRTARKPQKTDE